jgi:hypothetical protein
MKLVWADIVIDKQAVKEDPATLTRRWLWLVPEDGMPILPTACGDLFLQFPDGSVAFLDTYAGTFKTVATSYENWRAMLKSGKQVDEWFRGRLVAALLEKGLTRGPGQCFSPVRPQVIGGSWEPVNFNTCDLFIHLEVLGLTHCAVKDLPPGTDVSKIKLNIEWD